MRIIDFFEPTSIVADLAGSTGREVLTELCRPLGTVTGVEAQFLVEALLVREQLGSTAVGDGVAIPHAKVPGLRGLVAGFGRSRAGIDFKAADAKPTRIFFALFAPANGQSLHLNALARMSRLLKAQVFRDALLDARDAAEVHRLIGAEDAK
jgi:nitrogen PTS system EIIA component